MRNLSVNQPRFAYLPWLQTLEDFGDPVDVRGRSTLEVLDAVTVINEPWHPVILIPSRRWNPWIAMSEALWILAGKDDVASLEPFNRRIKDFTDDGNSLYGAYGARIYNQIDELIERLRKDPSDRRAVLQIWDSNTWGANDLTKETKDPPCNNLVYFKLRHGQLHETVICRSNDLHWGLFAVNIPTFSILLQYIAARLGVGIGTQTHLSNSLHIYKDDKAANEITDRMLYTHAEDMPAMPAHFRVFINLERIKDHVEFADMCGLVLDSVNAGVPLRLDLLPPFLSFAWYFLRCYRERDLTILQGTNARDFYLDWVESAYMFKDAVWK